MLVPCLSVLQYNYRLDKINVQTVLVFRARVLVFSMPCAKPFDLYLSFQYALC